MNLLRRVRAILFAPDAAWPAIAREETSARSLAIYVAVLAAIPALARFVGGSLVGLSASDGVVMRVPLSAGLVGALMEYALSVVAVAAVALVTNGLAPWFGAHRNQHNAFKLSVYAFTPYWAAGLFLLVPGLRFLGVLGLYGFYAAWTGLPRLMRSPPDASLGYATAVVASGIVMTILAIKLPDILLVHPRSV